MTDDPSEKQRTLLKQIVGIQKRLKDKYHGNTPEENNRNPLNKKQKELLKEIKCKLEGLESRYGKKSPEENERIPGFEIEVKEYNQLMLKALGMGLEGHPPVKEWLDTNEFLGQRDLLRKAKKPDSTKDFATGVKGPLPMRYVKLSAEIEEIVAEEKWTKLKAEIEEIVTREKKKSGKPLSREAVRRKLENAGRFKMSRQRFNKLITELGLQDLFI